MEVTITEEEKGLRLDRFVRKLLKDISLSEIYQLIKNGDILVNRKQRDPSYRLERGDRVFLPFSAPEDGNKEVPIPEGEREKVKILFADDYIIIADKPSGLPVHTGSGWNYGFFDLVESKMGTIYPVHRLDRDTSGIILFARRRDIARKLSGALKEHGIRRTYLALVEGRIKKRGRIDAPLEKKKEGMKVSQEGKHATTIYVPVADYQCCTLLKLNLQTGRTHQIRVHMANTGHPLAGDWRYGNRAFNIKMKKMGLKRLFLHSWQVSFRHPVTGRKVEITSPLPADLDTVLKNLS